MDSKPQAAYSGDRRAGGGKNKDMKTKPLIMVVQEIEDSGDVVQCCIVGDGLVGKTCLARSLLRLELPAAYEATLFDNYASQMKFKDKQYTISIHDTAGQQDYTGIRAFSYAQTDIVIVCFSMADIQTYKNVQELWVPEIQMCLQNKKPVILVGTQSDCKNRNSPCKAEYGHTLAKAIGAVRFVECSVYDKDSVSHLFETIIGVVYARGKRRSGIVRKLLKMWR